MAGRSTRSLDVVRIIDSLSDRAKSVLYTLSFWGGLALTGVGVWHINTAESLAEYLIAFGVLLTGGLVWALAGKLNPEDVAEFERHTSWDGKGADTSK